MSNLISRKDVLNILKHHVNEDIVDLINKLPSCIIDKDADINTLSAQFGLILVKDAYERKRLKDKICPTCGYKFKFGTAEEVELHRVTCRLSGLDKKSRCERDADEIPMNAVNDLNFER